MTWYSVRILFEVKYKRDEPQKDRLYSDSFFIVKAKDPNGAAKKAMSFAQMNHETSYKNYLGETVTWKLKKLIDVFEISEGIHEFQEVYSCFYRGWYPKQLHRPKRKK